MLTILSYCVAIVIAIGMIALALSIPGKTAPGLFLGLTIPLTGMIAWTYGDTTPWLVWAWQLAVGGAVMLWTFPWWRDTKDLWRFGCFWLAVPVWFFGAVSAVLQSEMVVAAQRVVYGGFAVLIALLALGWAWRHQRDISRGIAAGFLLCLALLLLSGASELFAGTRWTVDNPFGAEMEDRFWGGPLLGYHPNFIGLTAVMAAIRIGADSRLRPWQRWGSLAVAGVMLLLVESRTSFIVAFVAGAIFALGYLGRAGVSRLAFWTWLSGFDARRAAAVALAPLLVVGVVFAASGGIGLLTKDRYADNENDGGGIINRMLSGRVDIWAAVVADYADNPVAGLALGDAGNARGVYYSVTDPSDPQYETQAKHTADNVAIGMLYRGGVLGLTAAVAGLLLVLWRASREGIPMWSAIATAALVVGSLTEDEIASTAPAWLLLCGAELAAMWRRDHTATIPAISGQPSPNGGYRILAD